MKTPRRVSQPRVHRQRRRGWRPVSVLIPHRPSLHLSAFPPVPSNPSIHPIHSPSASPSFPNLSLRLQCSLFVGPSSACPSCVSQSAVSLRHTGYYFARIAERHWSSTKSAAAAAADARAGPEPQSAASGRGRASGKPSGAATIRNVSDDANAMVAVAPKQRRCFSRSRSRSTPCCEERAR